MSRSTSICFPDAEVQPPAPLFGLAVHQQPFDWIQLVPDVEANRANRCLVTEARSDRVPQIAQREAARLRPHVPAIEEEHAAKLSPQCHADLFAERQHAVAANRQTRSAERAHLVPPPAANARRAAEEILLREGDAHQVLTERTDVAKLQPARQR